MTCKCREEGRTPCGGCNTNKEIKVGNIVPDFETTAFHNNEIKNIRLTDHRGKWVVLFFYPGDFTFICPTELEELANCYAKLSELNTEILSISTDSVYVHKAWKDSSEEIKKVQYPMLSDNTHELVKIFNVYSKKDGVALRATFVIDTDGVLVASEIHNNSIGRSAKELIRKIEAAQFVKSHKGQVCPASWNPGDDTLAPGLDLVGKI